MALPKTASSSKLLILVGDGADPEVFSAPCGLTTKGIAFAADTVDQTVPDCDNPDDPSWVGRAISTLSSTVTGSGILALEALPTWRAYLFSGLAKNLRIKIDVPLADNGGYFAGSYLLTAFTLGGADRGKVTLDGVTLVSDGEVTWVAASA
jgi:predicted secreted protein